MVEFTDFLDVTVCILYVCSVVECLAFGVECTEESEFFEHINIFWTTFLNLIF
jgi:hypothetical protein